MDEAPDFFETICFNSDTYKRLRNKGDKIYIDYYTVTSPAYEILKRDGDFVRLKFDEFKASNFIHYEKLKNNKSIAKVYTESKNRTCLQFKLIKLDGEGWKIFNLECSKINDIQSLINKTKPIFMFGSVAAVPPMPLGDIFKIVCQLYCHKNGRNYYKVIIEIDGTGRPYPSRTEASPCLREISGLMNTLGK